MWTYKNIIRGVKYRYKMPFNKIKNITCLIFPEINFKVWRLFRILEALVALNNFNDEIINIV